MQVKKTLYQSLLWRGSYYGCAFIFNILLARHFEAAVTGEVYYISSVYAFALLFVSFSIESGIVYFSSNGQIPLHKLFNFSALLTAGIGILTFIITRYCIGDSLLAGNNNLLVLSSVSFICGNLLIANYSGISYAKNNFLLPNVINILSTVILITILPFNGVSIIPGVTDDNYFYGYFLSFLVQGILLAIVVHIRYIKQAGIWILSKKEFTALINYSAMAFAGNFIYFLLYRVDYWFVQKYCTAAELGNYVQVSKLVQLFFVVPTILASAIFPLTASGNTNAIKSTLTILSRVIFSIYVLVCIVLGITGKSLFPFMFGKTFDMMYQPFLLLIPGILAFSGLFTLAAFYAGTNRQKVNISGAFFSLIIIIAGDCIFIPRYGINAAALISSIGYIFYQVYMLIVFKKQYHVRIGDFYLFKISDIRSIQSNIFSVLNRRSNNDS